MPVTRFAVALAAVLLLGCGASTPPSTALPSIRETPVAATRVPTFTPMPTPTPAPAEPCGPGEAWVGSDFHGSASAGYGAACLDKGGWKTFDETNTPLSGGIADIAVCANGTTWLAGSGGLVSTDGKVWVRHASANKDFNAVACDPKKGVWLAAQGGIYYYDGETLTTHAASKLGTGEYVDHVMDVAVAADGHVWAVTRTSVATWDGTIWRYWAQGKGWKEEYLLWPIALDRKGRTWVGEMAQLLLYDGKKWSTVSPKSVIQPSALAVDTKDRLWVGTYGQGVSVFDGSKWVTYNRSNSDLPSDTVEAIAVDARGRVWIGTGWGLAVVDGKKWTVYHMSDSDIADNEVGAVTVAGRGPALPALEEKDPGTLTGRVVVGSQPQPGLTVEACAESVGSGYSGSSPCAGQAFHQSTTTGDDGVFTFAKLPVGRYAIVVQDPVYNNWRYVKESTDEAFTSVSKMYLVEPSRTTDVGELNVSGSMPSIP